MDMTKLIGKIVIFPFGTNKFKGIRVEKETAKKFEYDLYKNMDMEFKPKPHQIMKNTIIHVTDDKDEAIRILNDLKLKSENLEHVQKIFKDAIKDYTNTGN